MMVHDSARFGDGLVAWHKNVGLIEDVDEIKSEVFNNFNDHFQEKLMAGQGSKGYPFYK